MKRLSILLLCSALIAGAAGGRAKKVILFIGDAGGIPTLNAASIYGHQQPQKLFIQHMPHTALMETSAANSWVTDSAAAMSAIVTGQKTDNGVLSETAATAQSPKRVPLKTILEYAEENGLSTGVISNSPMWDATPAACYAHVDSRRKTGEIFAQVLSPRFGDGVDLIIGPGRTAIYQSTATLGIDLDPALKAKGYELYNSPDAVPASAHRVIALSDSSEFDLGSVVNRAVEILSRNRKGFFLMVESDLHTNNVKRGLERAVALDAIIRSTVERQGKDTLVVFAADHSFDLRVQRGRKDGPLLLETSEKNPQEKPNIRVDDSHTGEEVLVAAAGPGSERVQGFIANTDLFRIMLAAFGWEKQAGSR